MNEEQFWVSLVPVIAGLLMRHSKRMINHFARPWWQVWLPIVALDLVAFMAFWRLALLPAHQAGIEVMVINILGALLPELWMALKKGTKSIPGKLMVVGAAGAIGAYLLLHDAALLQVMVCSIAPFVAIWIMVKTVLGK